MSERRIDAFFYGLFMDQTLLKSLGIKPQYPRVGSVPGHALRIGQRATLVEDPQARAYGMVMALTQDELRQLYGAPGLLDYQPETVSVELTDGGTVAALCYTLHQAPAPEEANPDYARRLREVFRQLGFPTEALETICGD